MPLNKEMVASDIGFSPTTERLLMSFFSETTSLQHFLIFGLQPLNVQGMFRDPVGKSIVYALLNITAIFLMYGLLAQS